MTIWAPDLARFPGPRYQAIAEAIGAAIREGNLSSGDRLPPQRELAWKLGVTVGTVSRGYALAEQRGLLSGEVGRGTYIRSINQRSSGKTLATDPNDTFDMSVNTANLAGRGAILAETLREIASTDDDDFLLRYMPTAGHARHRTALVPWLKRHDLAQAHPDTIILTAGAAQGLMMSVSALTAVGAPVMAESLTYPGLIETAHVLNRPLLGLEMDVDGVIPDALERAAVDHHAKMAVLVPTIQNPTAIVMPEQRRRDIVTVAERHDLLLIEDDVYGNLPEAPLPPLAAMAPDRTIYIGSASKCLAPGLRVGWILTPENFMARLSNAIFATSVAQPSLTFEIAARWIESGIADQLVRDLRAEMTVRQSVTADVLGDFNYATQENAFHIWLELPNRWRGGTFAEAAAARKIRLMAGSAFMTGEGPSPRAVRISISRPPDANILARDLHILRDILLAGPSAGRTLV
ncbi:MAG: PLP-dependent aminotransferase family protein [Rhodospirillaceae bacterium]|nr:PLP-dependent aminotransferase family protein [Rhodospirillaceae bacterium]MCY4311750.1 PLP-dependent aminotransferase family protein [Rhodospirillaceae bacterium]